MVPISRARGGGGGLKVFWKGVGEVPILLLWAQGLSEKGTQRTLPYSKYYDMVNLICVVNLLSQRKRRVPSIVHLGGIVKTLQRRDSLFWSREKEKRIPVPVPPLFSEKAMQWGKKWPVQMNLPFFRCKSIPFTPNFYKLFPSRF